MRYARARLETRDDRPSEDHVVQIDGATWDDYERLLELRGERAVPRLTYLKGRLEIMTPSRDHEGITSLIGRLVDAYCLHAGIRFMPYGSWNCSCSFSTAPPRTTPSRTFAPRSRLRTRDSLEETTA